MEDIEFVAFVQNNSGKEIQNTIRPVMSDFEATTSTDICQHNSISFADNSIGRPGSVSWLFPGGSPASSTSESPSVVYHTPGVYDVTLITKTGLTVDTVTKEDYVNIRPGALVSDPTGLSLVCTNNLGQTTDYTTASTTASSFEWQLYPTSAGTVVNNGATCTIQWVHNWYGTASIRVRGSNDCGYGDWTQYMDISCTSCVEVEENPQQAVTVYPNPASKEMNLTLNTSNQQVAVKLINALGKVVYEEKVNTAKHSINVSRIPAGMYFLAVEGNNLNYTQKVTIQH
jgi:PKD repeat protein